MKEVGRRQFLKLTSAAIIGIATGQVVHPLKLELNKTVEQKTGFPAGNTDIRIMMEEACQGKPNEAECYENWRIPFKERIFGVLIAPPIEEFVFRGIPSFLVSRREKSANPISDLLYGTGGLTMSKSELVGGVISSLIFGGVHMFDGLKVKTIPASQIFGGVVSWYLQRKFGIVANTLEHMVNNLKA